MCALMLFLCHSWFDFVYVCGWAFRACTVLFFFLYLFFLFRFCCFTRFRYLNVVSHFDFFLFFFFSIPFFFVIILHATPNENCCWKKEKKNSTRKMCTFPNRNQFEKCGTEISFRYVNTRHTRSLAYIFQQIPLLTRDIPYFISKKKNEFKWHRKMKKLLNYKHFSGIKKTSQCFERCFGLIHSYQNHFIHATAFYELFTSKHQKNKK